MEFNRRKLRVWFISIIAIFALYLLYNQIASTPEIKIQTGSEFADGQADANGAQFGKEMGKVGDVGIGKLEMARFTTLNPKTRELEREFGFEKLLHDDGDGWEIEKPFMNIYRRDFKCYITADKGFVMLESDVSPPNPKDAILTGNVVAHIVPEPGSDVKESFVYLDDVTFVSEKSQFSTGGPVKFVSKDAQMLGRGLELVYNDELKRLALLRIVHLDSLSFKTSRSYSLSDSSERQAGFAGGTMTERRQKTKNETEKYKCTFSDNVVIDTSEQLIFTEQVSINNIVWSENSNKKPGRDGGTSTQTENGGQTGWPNSGTEFSEELVDIAVSCDNGIVVVPMNSTKALEDITGFKPSGLTESRACKVVNDAGGRTTLAAAKIDYHLDNADVIASGLSKLRFFVRDMIGSGQSEVLVPMTVTSQDRAQFLAETNRIIFEGDCLCLMERTCAGLRQEYRLSAPKLVVNLSEKKDASDSMPAIEHITAFGESAKMARLSSVKTADEEFMGGVELKCPKFEYDTNQQVFHAFGPGVVKADNSKLANPDRRAGRFSLQRRCYALVRNFDTLKYYLDTEQIVAENKTERVFIDYFPISEDSREQVSVTAGRIEADLVETAGGQYKLWTLLAADGISYHDGDKMFEGRQLFYDDQASVITAKGDESMPAYFNGIFFDGIEYDLVTDEVKNVQIKGPGFFRLQR